MDTSITPFNKFKQTKYEYMKESMIPTTSLLQGDCLELMRGIPDKSIDAIN